MNTLIAITPSGMMEAQKGCIDWAVKKLKSAEHEVILAEQNFNALHSNGLNTNRAQTMIRKARARVGFYEKVKAALDAGYYIIPPFDVQVFAVRTNSKTPRRELDTRAWERDITPPALPVGEGNYVDPRPDRIESETETHTNRDGTTREVMLYENGDWKDIELPVRAMKPQIIEETGKALKLKIFDMLGIAPAYKSADPIIVGQIRQPGSNKSPLTFFVAWWLDYSDL